MPVAKAGVIGPMLGFILTRPALVEASRVTFMVYVCTVTPSCAVTATTITLGPVFKLIGGDTVLEACAWPLTVRVALALLVNGVTVIELVACGTLAV